MFSYPPCQFSFFSRHSVPVYLPFRLIRPGASNSLFTLLLFYLPFRLIRPGGKYFSVYAPSFLLAFPLITPRGQVILCLRDLVFTCLFAYNAPGASILGPCVVSGGHEVQFYKLEWFGEMPNKRIRLKTTIIPRRLSVNPIYENRQPPRPGRSCYNLQKIFPIASFFIKNIHKSPKPLYNH